MNYQQRPKITIALAIATLALTLAGCSVDAGGAAEPAPSRVDFDAPSISLDLARERDPDIFQVGALVPTSASSIAWADEFFGERYPEATTTGQGDYAVYPDSADFDPETLVRDLEDEGFDFYPRTLQNGADQEEWFGTADHLVVSITRSDALAVIVLREVQR